MSPNPDARRIPNPESRIPLYACLYRPPAPDERNRGAREARGENICSAGSTVSPVSILAAIAEQFSPRYELHGRDLVSIDVTGLERLLGPAQTIGGELRREAAARGVRAHVAVAGTRTAAVVLALAQPGLTVVARGEEADALAPLAIEIIAKSEVGSLKSAGAAGEGQASDFILQTFTRWGLKTLGELAALPPADLAARVGKPALAFQAMARGEDLRPLIPALAEERFESDAELEWPVEALEPLSFVLTRLLEPLSTRLERRDRGAAVLHVLLRLVTRETYARRLELPSPIRDVRTLRTLALLDLESHPPGAGVDRVTVVIDPTPGRVLQHTLFTRAHPTPEQLSTLVARLGALMGHDRFGAPALVDSYRPGAFAMEAFKTDHESNRRERGERREKIFSARSADSPVKPEQPSAISDQPLTSALRRCRQPVPARVAVADGRPVRVTTDRRGFVGGAVVRAAGPWRTSGSWWVPDLPGWNRDEWDVALSDGAVYRVFRDLDTDGWFIDAIFD